MSNLPELFGPANTLPTGDPREVGDFSPAAAPVSVPPRFRGWGDLAAEFAEYKDGIDPLLLRLFGQVSMSNLLDHLFLGEHGLNSSDIYVKTSNGQVVYRAPSAIFGSTQGGGNPANEVFLTGSYASPYTARGLVKTHLLYASYGQSISRLRIYGEAALMHGWLPNCQEIEFEGTLFQTLHLAAILPNLRVARITDNHGKVLRLDGLDSLESLELNGGHAGDVDLSGHASLQEAAFEGLGGTTRLDLSDCGNLRRFYCYDCPQVASIRAAGFRGPAPEDPLYLTVIVGSTAMSAAALNRFMRDLGTPRRSPSTLVFENNAGQGDPAFDPAIATAKGWTVQVYD